MENAKDVMIGVLGASGAFAGLLLVFSGFIFAQAASFPSVTSDDIISKYTRAAKIAIIPFWGFLITTVLSLVWLLCPVPCVFLTCVVLFIALTIGTGIYGTIMAFRFL